MAERKSAVGSDPLDSIDPDDLSELLGEKEGGGWIRWRRRKPSEPGRERSSATGTEERTEGQRDPTPEEALARGRGYLEAGTWNAAVEAFRAALRHDSRDTEAIVGVADALLARGDREQAMAELVQGQQIAPDHVPIKIRLARAHARSAAYPEAETELRSALRLDPENAEARCELGIVLVKKGLHRDGIGELERALSIDPEQARAHYYLGVSRNQLDQFDRAIDAFERAVEADPADHRAYYQLGIIYDRKGMADRAREMYRRARELEGPGG